MSGDEQHTETDQAVDIGRPADEIDLDAIERDLLAVDRALARLDDGSYGRCLVCNDQIVDGDLAADPTETSCREHRQVPAG